MGIADTETELRIARLKWWQSIVTNPTESFALLVAFFGSTEHLASNPLTRDGRLHCVHPWLRQLLNDLECLAAVSHLDVHLNHVMQKPLLLFTDEEIRHDFLKIDPFAG